jgi:hypothetical protein
MLSYSVSAASRSYKLKPCFVTKIAIVIAFVVNDSSKVFFLVRKMAEKISFSFFRRREEEEGPFSSASLDFHERILNFWNLHIINIFDTLLRRRGKGYFIQQAAPASKGSSTFCPNQRF